MVGLLAPTAIALVAALASGGSVRGLVVNSSLRGWPAIVLGFGVELVLYNPPLNTQPWAMQVGPWVWLAVRLVFLAVLFANGWPSRGAQGWPWWLAALGLGLNTLVIALNNGHMPQSHDAAVSVWGASHIDSARLQNVAPIGAETRLPWLADIVAEPRWLPRPNVISVGDILLALGVATWVYRKTTGSQSVTTAATS
jgi:Family of unknown function (DUF5317)